MKSHSYNSKEIVDKNLLFLCSSFFSVTSSHSKSLYYFFFALCFCAFLLLFTLPKLLYYFFVLYYLLSSSMFLKSCVSCFISCSSVTSLYSHTCLYSNPSFYSTASVKSLPLCLPVLLTVGADVRDFSLVSLAGGGSTREELSREDCLRPLAHRPEANHISLNWTLPAHQRTPVNATFR